MSSATQNHGDSPFSGKEWLLKGLFFVALTGISFVIHGYGVGYSVLSSDQLLYLPLIEKSIDPALFSPHDLALWPTSGQASFYNDVLRGTLLFSGKYFFDVIFVLMFLTRFFLFFALYRVAHYFSKNTLVSLVSCISLAGGLLVYSTTSGTLGAEFGPSSIALPISLYALVLLMEGRRLLSSMLLAVAFLFHPLSSLVFIAVLFIDTAMTVYREGRVRIEMIAAFLLPLFAAALLVVMKPLPQATSFFIDPVWERVIRERNTYVYLFSWWGYGTTFLFQLPLDFCALLLLRLRLTAAATRERHWFDLLIVTPILFLVASVFLVDILQIHFIAELQILRTLVAWKFLLPIGLGIYAFSRPHESLRFFLLTGCLVSYLISETAVFIFLPALLLLEFLPARYARQSAILIVCAAYGGLLVLVLGHFKREPDLLLHSTLPVVFALAAVGLRNILGTIAVHTLRKGFLLISGGVCVVLLALLFVYSWYITPPWSRDADFVSACDWIQTKTPKSALFLTEPYSDVAYLPVACKRSVFVTEKNGSTGLFNRDVALEWKRRYALVQRIYTDPAQARALTNEGVKYIFVDKNYVSVLPFPILYENDRYRIYKL